MIRINLLPYLAARKKENIRKQISVFTGSVVLILVALFYYYTVTQDRIETMESKVADVKQEIKLYKKKAERVNHIKEQLEVVNKKYEIINSLKGKRRRPLVLLDSMSGLVVRERMWLKELSSDSSNVKLSGTAFDNKTVADFMTNLENSDLFTEVDLESLKMEDLNDIKVKSFNLTCSKADAPNTNEDTGKKKR
ncbi:MAG: PilN domain-containing protein [Desulfobacteraceae bacterium]